MKDFIFNIPTKIFFGIGSIKQLKHQIPSDIKKILVITDQTLIKTDSINKILTRLKEDFEICIFPEVEENPSLETIDKGAELAKIENVQLVIGVGGGSSLDAAKGIALTANNDQGIKHYLKGEHIQNQALPIICLPTTSGTGSEVTPFAVFTDKKNQAKCGFASEMIFPQISIIDPELTYTMPKNVIINTGLDVLTHAVEAYLSTLAFDLNDQFALKAVKIVFSHLKPASKKNPAGMQKMAYASMLAGIAITHASTILPHIMGYPLTVFHAIPHGLASALILYPFLRFIKENSLKEDKIACLEKITGGINNIKGFMQDLGISTNLRSYGIRETEFELFAQKTIVKGDLKITPGNITLKDIINIYQSSF